MKKHYIIPIFVPHLGCPHDCVFCNQRVITGCHSHIHITKVKSIVEEYLATMPPNAHKEIAFYGGSFTGIPMAEQEALLEIAFEFKCNNRIDGIRISTRPDYISEHILAVLRRYGVTTIELGVQSLDAEVLQQAQRGHTLADTYNAISLIRKFNFRLGIQLMLGLPGDNEQKALATAEESALLKPDFIRIYPTVVLTGTKLAELYQQILYQPLALADAVRWAASMLLIFTRADIPVIRIGLQPSEDIAPGRSIIAGPFHPAFRELVENEIAYAMLRQLLSQLPTTPRQVAFHANPRDISIVRGQKNANINKLAAEFGVTNVSVCADTTICRGQLFLEQADDVCCAMHIAKTDITRI